MRFKAPLPRPNRAFSVHPRTALKCLGVLGIIWFLLGVFVYRRSLLHRIAETGTSGSTGDGQDFRSRISREQLHLSVMNSFATRPFTSVKVSGSKKQKQEILVHFTPSHRRATLQVGTDILETLNVFLAYVVDFVSGSSDTIVPTTSLRKLSQDDVTSIASAMSASEGLTLKEGDVVTLVSRVGGFFSESLDENTKNPLCAFPYECSHPQFDPFMDEEVCFVQLRTRGERNKMVPLQHLDHSFVLDYFLFGNAVVNMAHRMSCGFVPDRTIEGGVLFVGTGFDKCCCSNNDFNDVEDRSLIARMCKITSSVSDRFAVFQSGKKTLGTAVREFLSSDQLPSEVRRVLDDLGQGCLSKFFQTLDQRVARLFKILETECPEREEMSTSDIYGQVPDNRR